MDKKQILADVQEIMQDVFDLEDLVITEETSAKDIEEWDSLSHIRLVVAIEKKYGIKFGYGVLNKMKNVGEMLEYIVANH